MPKATPKKNTAKAASAPEASSKIVGSINLTKAQQTAFQAATGLDTKSLLVVRSGRGNQLAVGVMINCW